MKVAIIESYPIILSGLSNLLRDSFEEMELIECGSYQKLITAAKNSQPDLIILGVGNQPNKACVCEIKIVGDTFPNTSIIVYDGLVNRSGVSELFNMGIRAYLSTMDDISDLKQCIADVLNGKKYIACETILRLLLKESNTTVDSRKLGSVSRRRPGFKNDFKASLSNGEKKVASLLCVGKRTSQIAYELGKKPSTVSTVKANIYRKLNVSNVVDLMRILRHE
jgi:DNA-binding NarL/FixJ family response regulator